ncbi:hypothetical protein L195_g037013, partial [Trifolium pratense]
GLQPRLQAHPMYMDSMVGKSVLDDDSETRKIVGDSSERKTKWKGLTALVIRGFGWDED